MIEETVVNIQKEEYNKNYLAYTVRTTNFTWGIRKGKKTPKKKGFIVSVWQKRNNKNTPLSNKEGMDFLIVFVKEEKRQGWFVFPSSALVKNNIFSSKETEGKMAFRLYPSWESSLNPTARRSQEWQCKYFVDDVSDVPTKLLQRIITDKL